LAIALNCAAKVAVIFELTKFLAHFFRFYLNFITAFITALSFKK
jgi:hypothetical protein